MISKRTGPHSGTGSFFQLVIHSFRNRDGYTKTACFPHKIAAEGFQLVRFSCTDIPLKRAGSVIRILIIEAVDDGINVLLSDIDMFGKGHLPGFVDQVFIFPGLFRILTNLPDGVVITGSGDVMGTV